MQHDVGVDVERFIHRALEGVQALGHQSRFAPALKLAPSDSNSSLIFNESRVGVPSSSMRCEKLAVPGPGRIGCITAVDQQREIHHRRGVPLGQNHFQAVRQSSFLQRGNFSDMGPPSAGSFDRSSLLGLEVGRIGLHFEDVVAIAQPVVRGLFHRGRGRGLDPRQIFLVAIGVAVNVWQRASRSLLPPKPPMRSTIRA